MTTLTGGNFNAPAAFNLNGGLGYDLTEGGANAPFAINGYADNNGIPGFFALGEWAIALEFEVCELGDRFDSTAGRSYA